MTANPSAEGRRFGLLFAAVFAALFGIGLLRGHARPVLAALSIAALAAALLLPRRLAGPRRLWVRLGEAISVVTQPVILGAVYFLVLTPTGLLRRWLGGSGAHWHDRRRGGSRSHWQDARHTYCAADLEKPF